MKTKNILFAMALLIFILIFRQSIANLLRIIGDQEAVSTYLRGYGTWGPIVLFLLMVAQVFVAVIPGHALMITAGYVYGTLGLFVIIASTILGSQIAFFIARRYGRSLIDRLAPPQVVERWDRIARNQGTIFYFFAFVLPIFPSDLMCYVAGLGRISARRFLVANILGRSVVAISITVIGMYGLNPPLAFWLVFVGGLLGMFAGWMIFKKRKGMKLDQANPCCSSSSAQ
jgi:uncharacterized membrane protein YdjX (TVP38/TMEM64 family)